MRILLISSSSGSRGGGELFLIKLAKELVAKGHEPILWCSSGKQMDELANLFTPIGCVIRNAYRNTYFSPFRSIQYGWRNEVSKEILDAWESCEADVFHFNKQNLEDGLDLLNALHKLKLPTLCTIHITQSAQFLNAFLGKIRDFVAKRYLNLGIMPYVVVQNARVKDLNKMVPIERIQVVRNGVEIPVDSKMTKAEWKTSLGLEPDNILFLAVGRLEAQKQPFDFIKAAEKLVLIHPKVNFVWVGAGSLAEEFDAALFDKKLPIKRIDWQKEMEPYYRAANCFMHTASFEGLPLAVLEAMAFGLPCFLNQSLIADLKDLAAAPLQSIDALVNNTLDLSKSEEWGEENLEFAQKYLSITQMTNGYLSEYTKLL